MLPRISFHPIDLATATEDSEGWLAMVDERLAAVSVRLGDEMRSAEHRGAWFVEAAFGAPAEKVGEAIIGSLEEAAAWIGRHAGPE